MTTSLKREHKKRTTEKSSTKWNRFHSLRRLAVYFFFLSCLWSSSIFHFGPSIFHHLCYLRDVGKFRFDSIIMEIRAFDVLAVSLFTPLCVAFESVFFSLDFLLIFILLQFFVSADVSRNFIDADFFLSLATLRFGQPLSWIELDVK